MNDAATIESINCEQLVTATDRWLMRAGRGPVRRPVLPSFAPPPPPAAFARGSLVDIDRTLVDRTFAEERTVSTRGRRRLHAPSIALGVAIPSLFGLAATLVALL